MRKIGIISTIPLPEGGSGYESALAAVNLTRAPGTGRMFLPFKERNNEYRTGLDPDAIYIRRITDTQSQKVEKEKVLKERNRLEEILKVDLSSRSDFYNIASWSPGAKNKLVIEPVKLGDGRTYFDLDDPLQAVAYAFLRVHPEIASSYEAYQRGEFPDARFYVVDDEIEQEITYRKKTLLNKAIFTLDNLSLEKRKKIARQCSLPVGDQDKEQIVYNHLDTFIKQGIIKSGPFEGANGVDIFMRFVTISDEVLHVKDLVRQAITHSIYRRDKLAKLFEGEVEIAKSEDDLIDYLLQEKNQGDLLMLEDKLRAKKSIML